MNSSWVTDRGMQMLCREENGTLGCSLIETLSIDHTHVTKRGIETILLALKSLQILHCQFHILLPALSKLSENFAKNGETTTLPLTRIVTVLVRNRREIAQIQRAFSICNQLVVNHLNLECGRKSSDLTDRDLARILSITHFDLVELSFNGFPDASFTFVKGIAPLLEVVGGKLQELHICGANHVDLSLVVTHCVHLKKLRLNYNTSYLDNAIPSKTARLRQLEEFLFTATEFEDVTHTFPSKNQLAFLFSSPFLKTLICKCCATLSDSVLECAFRQSMFENLKYISLWGCHSITNSGLDCFLRDENSIAFFHVNKCDLVDVEQFNAEFLLKKKERNWKVNVFNSSI